MKSLGLFSICNGHPNENQILVHSDMIKVFFKAHVTKQKVLNVEKILKSNTNSIRLHENFFSDSFKK